MEEEINREPTHLQILHRQRATFPQRGFWQMMLIGLYYGYPICCVRHYARLQQAGFPPAGITFHTINPEASLADFHLQPRHKTPSGVAFVQCYDCYGKPMVDVQRREEYHAALDFFDLMDWEKLKELDAMGW